MTIEITTLETNKMTIQFQQTAKPVSTDVLKAIFRVDAWLLDVLNQFEFSGPGYWVNARLPDFGGTRIDGTADIRIYNPEHLLAGYDAYGTLSEHTSPGGRYVRRIIIVPESIAHKHPHDPTRMDSHEFAACAFTWTRFDDAWIEENITPHRRYQNYFDIYDYIPNEDDKPRFFVRPAGPQPPDLGEPHPDTPIE